jgi:transposase, IS5 family
VLATKALPGSPYDGHTLATVIPHVEGIIGNEIQRIIADGYRGHGAPAPTTCGSTPPSKGAA